jgi:lysophospholipase L1-like esterase
MQKSRRTPVLLSLLSLLASLMVLIPSGVANAAESIPTLQWPSVTIGATDSSPVTSPNGDITVPCQPGSSGSDLVTYSATGQQVRQIDRTTVIDGVPNCITVPTADKNGHVYGRPYGKVGSTWKFGANLLAYNGNTLKWKYPLACSSGAPSYEVGANGNIYSTARLSDGSMRLIGLSPEVAVGQTEPTKVLDISIPTNCTTILRTYKDGVVLHAQSGGHARYYSYSGKFLGQATIGSLWDEKIDAEGRLFVSSLVAGSYQSASISRYDPNKGDVRWTVSASTSGANVNDITLSPLPGGAVAALITEQKMISGVPASPTVWVKTLVVINAAGVKVYSEQLESTYTGGTFGNSYLTSESGGKVVVTRELAVTTGLSNPTTVPGVAIRVFDPSNNTWTYGQGIIGDLTKSGGPSGYKLESMDLIASQPVNNILYVRAECTNNCNGSKKLFAVAVTGMGTNYPQGDVLTRSPRSSASYIALGDSFSSGEGVPSFEAGTDISEVNTCHRSTVAYPQLIAGSSANIPALGTGGFRACSGAVTTNVTDLSQWNEGIQIDWWPDTTTELVTLSIGGNDIGFGQVIETCAWPLNDCTGAMQAANQKVSTLGGDLERTYTEILTKMPSAKVYVVGYPPMFTTGPGCTVGPNQTDYPFYNETRKQLAIDLLGVLNGKIRDSVEEVQMINQDYADRLHFIDAATSTSPFVGHDICSGDPYFHGLILQNTTSSFHPNALGHEAYADLIEAEINS